jgi:hypothetical protein
VRRLGLNDLVDFKAARVFGGSFPSELVIPSKALLVLRRSSASLRRSWILFARLSVIAQGDVNFCFETQSAQQNQNGFAQIT